MQKILKSNNKYANLYEAEKKLEGKIGTSFFGNMSRTLIRKKSFKSTIDVVNQCLRENVKNSFYTKNNISKDIKIGYVKSSNGKEFKIKNYEKFFFIKFFQAGALITTTYTVKKNKLFFTLKVIAEFPLSAWSFISTKRSMEILMYMKHAKYKIKNNIKRIEDEKK